MFGTPRIHFDSIDSTNKAGLLAAAEGAAEGTVFSADAQTEGRGRRSREWYSPAGLGLYFSILLRPDIPAVKANQIVLQSAVAVCEAIEESVDCNVGIKWPNDIYVERKKIGGILVESVIAGRMIEYAVVGVGINVLNEPESFPPELGKTAASLKSITGAVVKKDELLDRILSIYEAYYSGEIECGIDKWMKRCIHLDEPVKIEHNGEKLKGIFTDIGADLSFQLKDSSGRKRKIEYGEISLNLEV
ncbi:MAG: biotin--[acetyl-CoA-carboxylase] ligase [Candidatus Marinimicrobia bacterium]|nr:biotin--[acetyl-CoA-carboxylase] ligase [Candidatus Neomarinimicrobiota bacterium]